MLLIYNHNLEYNPKIFQVCNHMHGKRYEIQMRLFKFDNLFILLINRHNMKTTYLLGESALLLMSYKAYNVFYIHK